MAYFKNEFHFFALYVYLVGMLACTGLFHVCAQKAEGIL